MKENDKIDYAGRTGTIQLIQGDIFYVYFHGHGIVKFGRDLQMIGDAPWEKVEAAEQFEEPVNTQKSKNLEKKIKLSGQKSVPLPKRWLH